MSEIVKVCKKHGELTQELVKQKLSRGKPYLMCLQCNVINCKNRYQRNKVNIRAANDKWIEANKEKYLAKKKESRKKYYAENREKILAQNRENSMEWSRKNRAHVCEMNKRRYYERREEFLEKDRRRNKKFIENLHDNYIRKNLSRSLHMKSSEIPQEIIDIKRVTMKIKRIKKALYE